MRRFVMFSGVLCSMMVLVSPLWAQNPNSGAPAPPATLVSPRQPGPPNGRQAPEDFGPNWTYTVYHAARWTPWWGTPTPEYYSGSGYIGPDYIGAAYYWTQIDLPNGAVIDYVYAVVYDDDTNGSVALDFHGYEGSLYGAAPAYVSFAYGETGLSETPGFTTIPLFPNPEVVVHEWADLNGDGNESVVSYNLGIMCLQVDSITSLRFWGAVVSWHRTISPATAAATYTDVPTSHWAFRFVEAMAASGITAGCGGGNYCPDNPITRAEMAVYLSAALGLHWPT